MREAAGLQGRNQQIGALLFGGAAVLVFAGILFRHAQVSVLGDYGEWTYHGVLLRDVLQERPDAGYVLKHYPVPNSLTTVGLGLLMLAAPWKIAAKLWLCIELILGLVCGYQLNRASAGRDKWMLYLLPAAVLCGINFWAGFGNFMFGLYFAMLLCAMLLRGVESRWLYAAVLLLAFFSHMIPFTFACLALALYAVQTRRLRLLWQMVPGVLMTAWYMAGRFLLEGNADGQAGMESSTRYLSAQFFAFKVNTYLKCWGLINPALGEHDSIAVKIFGAKIFCGLVMLDVGVAVVIAVLFWQCMRRAFAERRGDRFLWVAVGMFLAGYWVMPGTIAGISDPGGRMLQVAVWLGVMAIATTSRWQGPTLAGCSVLLLVANGVLFSTVGFSEPEQGATAGSLPEHVRTFAHVYFADRAGYPGNIERQQMNLPIYPTALFLRRQ